MPTRAKKAEVPPFVTDSLPCAAALVACGIALERADPTGYGKSLFVFTAPQAHTLAADYFGDKLMVSASSYMAAFDRLRTVARRNQARA